MKRFLKVFAVALSLCLCVFGLAACGANPEVTKEEFEAGLKLDATNMTLDITEEMGGEKSSRQTIVAGDKIKATETVDGKELITYYEKSGEKYFMYADDAWEEIGEAEYQQAKPSSMAGVMKFDMFEFKNGVYSSKAITDMGILAGGIKLTFADKKLVKTEMKMSFGGVDMITTTTISYSSSVTTPDRSYANSEAEVTKEEFKAALQLDETNMTINNEAQTGEVISSSQIIIAGDKIQSTATVDGEETISYYEKSGTDYFMYSNGVWQEIDENSYESVKTNQMLTVLSRNFDMFEFKNGVYSSKANPDMGTSEGDIKLTFADKKLVKFEMKALSYDSDGVAIEMTGIMTISYSGSVTTPARP